MFNELIALTFVPSLINPEFFARNGTLFQSITNNQTTTEALAEQFLDELILGVDNATEIDESPYNFTYGVRHTNDALLDEINREIEALHLEFTEDELDVLEDNSEEVRKLIASRQYSANSISEDHPHRESRDLAHEQTTTGATQFPVLVINESSSTSVPTTSIKPTGIPAAAGAISKESASIIGTLKKPIEYIGGWLPSFKKRTTTTTTTTLAPTTVVPPRKEAIVSETTTETLASAEPLIQCSGSQTEFNGGCHNVFDKKQCPSPTQWLVEDPVTMKGKCVENPCHNETNKAFFGDKCVVVRATNNEASETCHPGMITYIYKSGIVFCDCKQGYLYNEKDGNCYKAYFQEPCGSAQYFIIPKKRNENDVKKPMCMPNPCLNSGEFCAAPSCPKQRGCAKIGSQCGPESRGRYIVDPLTNSPTCDAISGGTTEAVIGNVPTLSCAPGSRRDILGNCRAPTEISFS